MCAAAVTPSTATPSRVALEATPGAGALFAVGGYSTAGTEETSSVECYDLSANAWSAKEPIGIGKGNACGAVLDGKLYVAGGSRSNSVHRFDPLANTWEEIASLGEERLFACAAVGRCGARMRLRSRRCPGDSGSGAVLWTPSTQTA